ncbi:DUF2946 domain-containing protein [Superficieibacter sp.]|uniref:DUF2946 domain-containing protein n=1 Tax=Superficieibacter sp. TaxID=2303322 RepID=UPI0028A91E34|nr:DUF2946 domain-containing protein [Superficieibacter sp.]
MHAHGIYRLRFLKKHLLMLLLAFGWLLIQSQMALASHDCALQPQGEAVMIQHLDHQMTHPAVAKAPLCDKHCVPDTAQKITDHPPVVALPVAMTLDVMPLPCQAAPRSEWSLTPPAAGPPATIRFCRFRE